MCIIVIIRHVDVIFHCCFFMIARISFGLVWAMAAGYGMLFAHDFQPLRLCPVSSPVSEQLVPVHSPFTNFSTVRTETVHTIHTENWSWQQFPDGFIYPNYLAAVQNRLGCAWNYDPYLKWDWDITLGGRAPLIRYGNRSTLYPEGWQLDLEGSVHLRLNLETTMHMEANDFRVGLPISYGTRIWQVKFGYYHVSTHMGDERVIRNFFQPDGKTVGGDPYLQGRPPNHGRNHEHRVNYVREALLFGYAYRPTPNTRLYAEVDYAFWLGEMTKPWHFQFGWEYSPVYPARGGWGTPFAAVNVRLMQEFNFDGNYTVQAGWQWRGSRNELFRIGTQYFYGVSEQYSFILHPRENKFGVGVWYDF